MNIKKLTATTFAVATGATITAAVPQISNVTMAQDTTRQVTITYTLADAPAVVTVDVQTNNANGAWASIGGEAVWNATGDVWKKVETGSRTITWRPDLSWPDHKIADGGARAVVTAWALDNTPDYMVVDITATGGADTQTYYPAADFVPSGVTNHLYKTTTLLMRKIMAKDVTWTMGSVAEIDRIETRETPHQVKLDSNYYIGVYEVTQTQWQQVTGYNPSNFKADRTMRPVENVSYTDIRQGEGTASTVASATDGVYPAKPYDNSFLGILRDKTKLDFDLPSEAQWEFAARAGNGEGHWGDGSPIQISSDKDANLDRLGRYHGNIGGSSTTATLAPSAGGTNTVGSYEPNSWGLYDVHGNVWEWCLDGFKDNIADLNGSVNAEGNGTRLLRGGCWDYTASNCRSAIRIGRTPAGRKSNAGFRVACTAGLQ